MYICFFFNFFIQIISEFDDNEKNKRDIDRVFNKKNKFGITRNSNNSPLYKPGKLIR